MPCFMCDPSILNGARCGTGYPICNAHRQELGLPIEGGESDDTERAARVPHRAIFDSRAEHEQDEQAVHPHEPRASYLDRAADALDHV